MSHTTRITGVEITDVDALRAAVNDLKDSGIKCDLVENTKPRAYYDRQEGMGKAELVLQLHDAQYDVGLYKEGNNYECRTDFYGGSVERVLGVVDNEVQGNQKKLGKLYQMYSVNTIQRSLSLKGINSTRTKKEDGTIQLMAMVA